MKTNLKKFKAKNDGMYHKFVGVVSIVQLNKSYLFRSCR